MRPLARAALLFAAAAGGTAACDVALPGAAEISVTSPGAMAEAELPVEVRWEADGRPAGGFAVFVDRAPIATGRDLRSLATRERDNACLARPDCPDADWLRARRVYLTDSTAVTIDAVDDDRGGDVHTVTVVALDADGERPSAAGGFLEFVVARGD